MNRFCHFCGARLEEGSAFCGKCGTQSNHVVNNNQDNVGNNVGIYNQSNINNQDNNNFVSNTTINRNVTNNSNNGLKIASLVLGITSLVLVLFINVLTIPLAIIGLILGIIYSVKSKKFCAGIACSVLLLVLLQGFLGIALAMAVGMHPLLGIQIGTGALAGGVGTTSAFGPVYEAMGAAGATEIGVSSATLGMIIGSLTGGPIAVLLIKRHHLKSDPKDLEFLKK